jgi:MFS transporter, AAHS family, 4-hydroxybenzoate transporter
MGETIEVSGLIDSQRVGRYAIGVLVLCVLVTLADGYNISVTSFAAPPIVKAWSLNRAALGPLFSSSLVAGLIGPFLFGTLGDRFGRRGAIVASTVMIGVFGLISGLCRSLAPLIVTRFIAGVGMSGALAVTVALINEFAPRRLRATFVTIVFSGTTIGSGLPGLIAPALIARFGWPSLFFVGGGAPLLLCAVLLAFLPESPKYLALRPDRHGELAALLQRLDPTSRLAPGVRFVSEAQTRVKGLNATARLFSGRLVVLTPLLWLGAFIAMIVFHSFNTWLPTLLTDSGVPFARAALTVALFQFVGTLGGWSIMRPIDALGMIPCTLLYALSIPLVLALSLAVGTGSALFVLIPIAGFCILGLHFAQVACVSNIYPTQVRATGVGWFMLWARAGGAVGPAIVGLLVGHHVGLNRLFDLATIPLAIGTVASVAVTVIYNAHYHRNAAAPTGLPVAAGEPQA